jgi:hypothetical protein
MVFAVRTLSAADSAVQRHFREYTIPVIFVMTVTTTVLHITSITYYDSNY